VRDDDETVTCERCDRDFNVADPLVDLRGSYAVCPHCGQGTNVGSEAMDRARKARGET